MAKENFPVESLRYMEAKIAILRRKIMDSAAARAKADSQNSAEYSVQKSHIAITIADLLHGRLADE